MKSWRYTIYTYFIKMKVCSFERANLRNYWFELIFFCWIVHTSRMAESISHQSMTKRNGTAIKKVCNNVNPRHSPVCNLICSSCWCRNGRRVHRVKLQIISLLQCLGISYNSKILTDLTFFKFCTFQNPLFPFKK